MLYLGQLSFFVFVIFCIHEMHMVFVGVFFFFVLCKVNLTAMFLFPLYLSAKFHT